MKIFIIYAPPPGLYSVRKACARNFYWLCFKPNFSAFGDYSRPLVDRYCRLWSTKPHDLMT